MLAVSLGEVTVSKHFLHFCFLNSFWYVTFGWTLDIFSWIFGWLFLINLIVLFILFVILTRLFWCILFTRVFDSSFFTLFGGFLILYRLNLFYRPFFVVLFAFFIFGLLLFGLFFTWLLIILFRIFFFRLFLFICFFSIGLWLFLLFFADRFFLLSRLCILFRWHLILLFVTLSLNVKQFISNNQYNMIPKSHHYYIIFIKNTSSHS